MKVSIEALKDSIQGTRSLTPIRLASPLNLQHFKGGVVADAALIAVDPLSRQRLKRFVTRSRLIVAWAS